MDIQVEISNVRKRYIESQSFGKREIEHFFSTFDYELKIVVDRVTLQEALDAMEKGTRFKLVEVEE